MWRVALPHCLTQHETPEPALVHLGTAKTSANAVIKAEARLANALIKALAPYHSLMDDIHYPRGAHSL